MEAMYKEEQALRKKYYNMMEDMKGKIRVYARCRPMAKYEMEKNCSQVRNGSWSQFKHRAREVEREGKELKHVYVIVYVVVCVPMCVCQCVCAQV